MALKIDIRKLVNKIERNLSGISAETFRPELKKYAKKTLESCVKITPQRNLSLIKSRQSKQYENRVNYIPSIHELADPTLIVKDDVYWLFADGKWWAASYHNLPPDIDAILQDLVQERERRLDTSVSDFVNERAQARFLYRKSWWQVSTSIGTPIAISSEAKDSHSRPYHIPAGEPPKGYGQWRGGKEVLSIVVFNPFLMKATKFFRTINGKQILAQASAENYPRFIGEVTAKLNRIMQGAK
jgi:hypothetical protein